MADNDKKGFQVELFLGPLVGVLVFLFALTRAYERAELVTYDWRFNIRHSLFGPPAMNPNLGTIDIDLPSVDVEGRYQDWTRDKYTEVVTILSRYGASMLGFDVFFIEPSTKLISEAQIRELKVVDGQTIDGLLAHADYDEMFREAIAEAENVYLAQTIVVPHEDLNVDLIQSRMEVLSEDEEDALAAIRASSPRLMVDPAQSTLWRGFDFDPPLKMLRDAARGFAYAQTVTDVDGARRRYPLVYQYEDIVFPSMALAVACDYLKVPIATVEVWPGKHVRLPAAQVGDGAVRDIEVPIDDYGNMNVNWAGKWDETFNHYPHIALRKAYQREEGQQLLDDIKRLASEDPALRNPRAMRTMLTRLAELGHGDRGAILAAYRTYLQAYAIEAAARVQPGLAADEFWRSKGVASPSVDQLKMVESISRTHRVAELIASDPVSGLDERVASLLDADAQLRLIVQLGDRDPRARLSSLSDVADDLAAALADSRVRRLSSKLTTQNPDATAADLLAALRDSERRATQQSSFFVRTVMVDGLIPESARPLYFFPYRLYHPRKGVDRLLTPDDARGKILFYGLTAPGTTDLSVTPVQGSYPMVGIYPNVMNTILEEQFIRRMPPWVDFLLIIAIGVFLSLAIPRLRVLIGALLVAALAFVYGVIALLAFAHSHLWLEMVAPMTTLVVGYIALTIYGYIKKEKEKEFVQGAFGHYLSPAVVDQIMTNPDMINQLGGEERVMTSFFSDVASFSTISECLSPSELVEFINDYLSEMCDIVEDYGGTIDKFEGDAILAFFGAPVFVEDHAVRGCLACVDQQRRMVELRERWNTEKSLPTALHELRDRWEAEGRVFAHVRMGLTAGPMVVGNMGSRSRTDYTMMGDTVNLAARFESGQKMYGTGIMVNQAIQEAVADIVETRRLDLIQVVGKEEPVIAYEVLDRKGDLSEQKSNVLELYNRGLEFYERFEFEEACKIFGQALEIDPNDGPSALYADRCGDFTVNPPDDLVFRAQSK